VKTVGGKVSVSESGIRVENADEATLYFTCGTNYKMESRVFLESDPLKKLAPYADPHAAVTKRLDAACEMTYDELYARHVADYRKLFGAVTLNIGYDEADFSIPTNILLARYQDEGRSAYLETLYYQYGRYLLIASSRPGGYPATLQGTWTAYDSSPWGSDYHHNINVQMNYWPSGIANLAECFIPYSDYAEAYMAAAKRIADDYIAKWYPDKLSPAGENGWALGTAALLYCITGTSAKDHSGPGTGAFTSLLFWDYYTFTGDKKYLREVAYPILRDMSLFLSKTLVEKDGKLLVRYSASPEQQNPDGSYYQTTGCAFDQQMVYENHRRVLESAEILGITADPVLDVIRSQIDRLDPVLIGLDGQVKEFREEEHYGDIGEYTHRHISHLVGLYPATIINKNTPEWLEGAKISLTNRSDKSTGWAAAHRLCSWARTGMGNRAYDLYYSMLKNNTLPNLWDNHPPFQIDGNFGAVAGISEMLLQSQAGFIDFIAALPDVWRDGSFDGLVARGNFVCGCDFSDGKVTEMRITARSGGVCRVKYEGIADAKVSAPVNILLDDVIEIDMEKGESITIRF
jgi:alpha-L-fucosidase 2